MHNGLIVLLVVLCVVKNGYNQRVDCFKETFSETSLGRFQETCGKLSVFVPVKYSSVPEISEPLDSNGFCAKNNENTTTNSEIFCMKNEGYIRVTGGTAITITYYMSRNEMSLWIYIYQIRTDYELCKYEKENFMGWIENDLICTIARDDEIKIEVIVIKRAAGDVIAIDYISVNAADEADCYPTTITTTEETTIDTTIPDTTTDDSTTEETTIDTTIPDTTTDDSTTEETTIDTTIPDTTTNDSTTEETTTDTATPDTTTDDSTTEETTTDTATPDTTTDDSTTENTNTDNPPTEEPEGMNSLTVALAATSGALLVLGGIGIIIYIVKLKSVSVVASGGASGTASGAASGVAGFKPPIPSYYPQEQINTLPRLGYHNRTHPELSKSISKASFVLR